MKSKKATSLKREGTYLPAKAAKSVEQSGLSRLSVAQHYYQKSVAAPKVCNGGHHHDFDKTSITISFPSFSKFTKVRLMRSMLKLMAVTSMALL
jgi:hypothetical protein